MLVALAGAVAWGVLALHRGETISAAWLVLAAVGTYLVAYRFYSRFLADRVFGLNDRRATPAERLNNGRDFVPTQRWVLFGHHFAAIAGAGPLVGPVLAAQFGYLPGTIWIVFGVVLGGAVQDFVILFGSMRRDGKSLGQMAKEETGPVTGLLAMVAILAIMVILLAVLALVVVNALKDSPWGVFTILCTIPIAMLMGFWMKVWRPGRTLEASALGVVLLLAGPGRRAVRRRVGHAGAVLHLSGLTDRLGDDRLRVHRERAAGVDAALPPRLPLDLHEDRHHPPARARHPDRAAAAQAAGGHPVHRRHRAGLRRQALSLRLHHHRLRRHQRIPRPGRLGYHAQDAHPGERRPAHRLRRHADGVVRGRHGAVRRRAARPGDLLRHQRAAGHAGRQRPERRRR